MRPRLAILVVLAMVAAVVNVNTNVTGAAPDATASQAQDATPGDALLAANESPGDHAMASMVANASEMGLSPEDLADMVVTDTVVTTRTGTTNVYIQQRYLGIDVFGAVANVTINTDGAVVATASRFVPGLQRSAPATMPRSSILDASVAASSALGLAPTEPFVPTAATVDADRKSQISDGGISRSDIPVRLVLQPTDTGLRLAWELTIEEIEGDNWWQIRVDADTGMELSRNNLVAADTYEVYDAPTEAPSFGGRTTVVDPADPIASPFGWFDTDGIAGPESTLTQGNNVIAYTDTDGDNQIDAGSQPDGGASLLFDFPVDLAAAPLIYKDALVANLFYWNNVLHDTFYAYGFDEAAGNFQQNNYGNGGAGGDAVLAEALDGSGTNNANFATPPDGIAPRMQMFRWTPATPDRASSFDNAVIAHEYGHGITNRLTGGPSNIFCLTEDETAGEGWSDFFGLMMTIEPGDTRTDPRPFATYLMGESPAGAGIRDFPYSTAMATDPRTYDSIKTATVPHGVGSVFATMLWEMTWDLIDRDGFDPDLINGTGGNNTAMQLVVDGLKLQPCNPGFVDSRDAILLADQLSTGGLDECVIWSSFAKRGLGYSATQGTSASATDGVEAFDIPPQCRDLQLTKSVSNSTIAAGAQLIYSLEARNNSAADLTGVTVTDPIPPGTTYALGSVDCGGSVSAGIVTFPIGTLAPGTAVTCSFIVSVDVAPTTSIQFDETFETGAAGWTISNGVGTANWAESTANPNNGATSMFATNVAAISDQYLTSLVQTQIGPQSVLRFWHDYDLESDWDGGVVEVSTDGVAWDDVGSLFMTNGYSSALNASTNPLTGREAFTGTSGGYVESAVDLSSYAGSDIFIRFRLGTDNFGSATGWYVDDIRIQSEVRVENTANATSNEAPSQQATAESIVVNPGYLRATTVPPIPSQITLDGTILDRWGIDWAEFSPGTYEICFTDVLGWQTPPCSSIDVQSGLVTTFEGIFIQNGEVRVITDPPVAGTISVDGVPYDDWEVWLDMAPGPRTICFGDVAGFTAPGCETISVTSGGALQTITGNYIANPGAPGPTGQGYLRVNTSPPVASRISVDGIVRDTWALNWVKMAPGTYQVCFSDVIGFTTPGCEIVEVTAGQISTVEGAFAERANLRVTTEAPHASTIFIDGLPRDEWGIWTDIPVGDYLVCFGEDAGFAPPCQTVSLVAGPNPTVVGTWPP